MEHFRTIVDIPVSKQKLGYHDKIMLLGSCFTEEIGKKLEKYKFSVEINPFGIIYNPVSVANSLQFLKQGKIFKQDNLNFFNGQWFSFYHHSRFSHTDLELCLKNINSNLLRAAENLKQVDYLFISFGTAWVYKHLASGKIVSNCHKLPAREFNRHCLQIDEIVKLYKKIITSLTVYNPKLKIVFTVSPLRHWKDGAHGNQLSKATLLLAVEQLVTLFEQASYFPSYEIVMDELRDYRFYSEDMIHVNQAAVNYIWKRFRNTYFNKTTEETMAEVEKIIKASAHKPFKIVTEEHQKFLQKHLEQLETLALKYPFLNLEQERKKFKKAYYK